MTTNQLSITINPQIIGVLSPRLSSIKYVGWLCLCIERIVFYVEKDLKPGMHGSLP